MNDHLKRFEPNLQEFRKNTQRSEKEYILQL